MLQVKLCCKSFSSSLRESNSEPDREWFSIPATATRHNHNTVVASTETWELERAATCWDKKDEWDGVRDTGIHLHDIEQRL